MNPLFTISDQGIFSWESFLVVIVEFWSVPDCPGKIILSKLTMSIRRALSSIPGKPGVVFAVIAGIIVLSVFYFKQYKSCTDIASLRSMLSEGIRKNAGTIINLADMTPFEWEKARVIINHQSAGKVLDCPFGWDWTQKQRRQLMANGQLNVIAFARKNINTVVDFSQETIDFELVDTIITPDSAKFHIAGQNLENGGYLLRQIK